MLIRDLFLSDVTRDIPPVVYFHEQGPDKLAAEVLSTLEHTRVDDIVVVSETGQPVGMVDTQDLTRFKLV